MRYAIISDIHANANALETILEDARRYGAARVVCLGDVVGYGPQPAKCINILRQANAVVIAGNNDDAVSARMDTRDFNTLAADAVSRHRNALSKDHILWLKSLPYALRLDDTAVAAHGDIVAPRDFRYLESTNDAAANFAASNAQIIFVGHTHVPQIFITGSSGNVYALDPQDFTIEVGKRYIVNVGSVGYPRESNGICRSSYVIYDSVARSVEYRFLPFAVSSVMQRGRTCKPKASLFVFCLSLCALAVALCAAFSLWRLDSSLDSPPISPATNGDIHSALGAPIAQKIFPLKPLASPKAKKHSVCANLVLENSSAPVILTVEYIDAQGLRHLAASKEVAKSSKGKFSIPSDAVKALFNVYPKSTPHLSRIANFSPIEK